MIGPIEISKALIVTAEMVGHPLSEDTIEPMVDELLEYDPGLVLKALIRCRRELRGRLTLGDVLDRIETGHPGTEEAWAKCPRDEATTVVWTDEMAEAFGVSERVLSTGDKIGARMAFKETYERLVAAARAEHRLPTWSVSLGTHIDGRGGPVLEAVKLGRLSAKTAETVIGGLPDHGVLAKQLTGGSKSIKELVSDLEPTAKTEAP